MVWEKFSCGGTSPFHKAVLDQCPSFSLSCCDVAVIHSQFPRDIKPDVVYALLHVKDWNAASFIPLSVNVRIWQEVDFWKLRDILGQFFLPL
jgi:hypothetical protein